MGGMRICPIGIHPFAPSWRQMLTVLMKSRDRASVEEVGACVDDVVRRSHQSGLTSGTLGTLLKGGSAFWFSA